MALFENANYDFIKWRWHAIAFSTIIIVAGLAYGLAKGVPLGIDFSGGTILVVQFEQPVSDDQVREALQVIGGEQVIQAYGDPAANQKLIRLPQVAEEEGAALDQNARAVIDGLTTANFGKFEVLSQELVGPVIGADLQRKGIYATLASIIGITIYIGLRFRFAFAIGAIAATLHDILVTVAFLFFFGYDLSLNIVAAILTITGYSVNDTIVIFSTASARTCAASARLAREGRQRERQSDLSRTIITAGTTVPCGALAYVRRRGARRFRVHDAGRHRQRHLLDDLLASSIAILLGNTGQGTSGSARKVS